MYVRLLLILPAFVLAQQVPQYRIGTSEEQPTAPPPSHPFEQATYYGAGLQPGWMSGIGLSFRVTTPLRWGGEATFGILKLRDFSFWCLGGELHYRLGLGSTYQTYLLAGLGYYSLSTDTKESSVWPVRFGLGLGAETFPIQWLALGAEIAITAYTNGDAIQVLPMPQFGVMYYFR